MSLAVNALTVLHIGVDVVQPDHASVPLTQPALYDPGSTCLMLACDADVMIDQ